MLDFPLAIPSTRHMLDMMLDEGEEASAGRTQCMRFQHPSLYMPGSMNRTKASALDGPKPGVLPVAPLTSAVAALNGKRITSIDDRAQA